MKREPLFQKVFSDWPAKVLSLAAAILLMFFFNLTRLEQRTLTIPLAVSVNDEVVPSSSYPRTVRITLRGERDIIYGIREDDIAATLDLAGYRTEGVFRVPVRIERRGAALNADPLEIRVDPSEIALGLEKKTVKTVPITPAFKGFLESGYELASFELVPTEIRISGPAGAVARTTEISTDTIELTGKNSDFTANVGLVLKNSLIDIAGNSTVKFSAQVRKSLDVKTLDNVKIAVKGLLPSLALAEDLPPATIRIHAAQETSSSIDPNGLLYIDLSQYTKPGTFTVDVILAPPTGAVIETFDPQRVTIRLQGVSQPRAVPGTAPTAGIEAHP
jgi:YbbR domain-containing protein